VIGGSLIAIAASLSLMPQAAAAQAASAPQQADVSQQGDNAADNTDSNAIVVNGFGASIANSLRVKRESIAVVDSVTAEDVGKLPDISIVDAISRLPGVAVQTQQGRGEVISIRGFSGDFTGALLNHREIATIDDNRRYDYGQLPGDLFGRVDVIKTASSDIIGTGLAGTVDLQTLDPLKNKRTVSLNAEGQITGYHKLNPDLTNKGYKATAIYIDKFADDTLGVSLGVSASQSPVENKQYDAWGYPGQDANSQCSASAMCNLGGGKWFADTNVQYRQTGFGHVVYKPDDKFEMSVDALYSNYKYREYQRGLEVPLVWGGVNPTGVNFTNGFATTGTFNPVYAVQRNNYNTRDAHTLALGGNLKYALSDKTKLVVDVSYSHAHRHDNAYESYSGTGYAKSGVADTVKINLLPNGVYQLTPTLNYTDTSLFKLTDPQGWGYYPGYSPTTNSVVQAGYVNEPEYTDTIKALRAALEGEFNGGFLKGWEFGVNAGEHTKRNSFVGFYLVPPVGTTSVAIPQSAIVGSVNPAYVNGSTIAYSVPGVLGALSGSFRNVQPSESTKQWYVDEKSITAYWKIDLDGHIGSIRTTGNFGAQLVYTDQHSLGNSANSASLIVPTNIGARFAYVLPNANLKFDLANDMFIHLSASRTMARARLSDENASFTVSALDVTTVKALCGTAPIGGKCSVLAGNGGNPGLRPYLSDNADLSIEKYFAHGQGVVALGAFYKHVTNFVEANHVYVADLSAFASSVDTPGLTNIGVTNTTLNGYVASPANSGKGHVDGVELQTSIPLSLVSPVLTGFGVVASGAYTESSIRFSNGNPVTLPGLSKWVVNAQAYFEKYGFNARVSYQYRSDFLGEYLAFGQQLALTSTRHKSTIDAQVGYDFKSGPMHGLSIYLQGHNLTNAPFVTYANGDPKQVLNYETYGPTYLLGATLKF
jgi:iron complex outermembrane receptor protein